MPPKIWINLKIGWKRSLIALKNLHQNSNSAGAWSLDTSKIRKPMSKSVNQKAQKSSLNCKEILNLWFQPRTSKNSRKNSIKLIEFKNCVLICRNLLLNCRNAAHFTELYPSLFRTIVARKWYLVERKAIGHLLYCNNASWSRGNQRADGFA